MPPLGLPTAGFPLHGSASVVRLGKEFRCQTYHHYLELPYIEVSINIQSVRYHLVNHPFSLFRGPVARPAPGPTHPHRSPLKPSVYCSFSSPRCPTLPLVSPVAKAVAKAGVGAAEMVLSQAPLLGVCPDGGGGGEGVSVRGCPSWGFELAHG